MWSNTTDASAALLWHVHSTCNVIDKQGTGLLAGVRQLSALRRLSSLDVMYCWKLTDGAMLMLSEIESLVSLNIIGCHRLSKLGKGHVQHLLDHFHSSE